MQRASGVYRDSFGRPVSGASVTVYLAGTQTLASIYTASGDPVAPPTQANPFTTASDGSWSFAAPNGRYDFSVSSTVAATQNYPNVFLSDVGSAFLANPMTTQGDMMGGSVGGAVTRIPGNATATIMYMSEANGAIPSFKQVAATEISGLAAFIAANGVASFNTRTGAVVPSNGDYTVAQVTGAAPSASITSFKRGIPAGLPALPLTLNGVYGVGQVDIYPNDAIVASRLYEPSLWNTGVYYVKPSTGSDSNNGTSSATPFATVDKAFRTATGSASRVVMLEDAVIPPFDLRATDASQTTQQFKWLDANGHKVTIRVPGPDLTTQTWAQDGTYTNCYKTTLAVSGSQAPKRIFRMDQYDPYGYYQELINYTSAANLNAASGDGWFWDGTSVLWVKIGAGTNVQNQRAILKGLYQDSSGNFRILCYGAALALSGVTLEGVQFVQLDLSGRRPEIWLHNIKSFWAADKGADLTNAGWFVATDSLVYSSRSDAVNAFAPSSTGPGLILTARCTFMRAGNFDIFPIDGSIQGTSAHGGSNHVGWGNQYVENNGQQVADTCINNSNDITWLVACYAQGGALGPLAPNYLIGAAATSASRKGYFDTCESLAPSANGSSAYSYDLYIDANGTAYSYNSALPYVSGTAPTAYAPLTPP